MFHLARQRGVVIVEAQNEDALELIELLLLHRGGAAKA
jgi:hypothetical protein